MTPLSKQQIKNYGCIDPLNSGCQKNLGNRFEPPYMQNVFWPIRVSNEEISRRLGNKRIGKEMKIQAKEIIRLCFNKMLSPN